MEADKAGDRPTQANQNLPFSRRQFLWQLAAAGAGLAAVSKAAEENLSALIVENPLLRYPNRDWERVYRNLYKSDTTFTFLCAPNDTHNCLLFAHVKNGAVTRISPTYGYQKATDLEGNRAGQRWDPRVCQKGLALVRRFYGDRRAKRPMLRKGFKQWVDEGCPRDPVTGAVDPEKYLQRGKDPYIGVTWDEAFVYSAKAIVNIAKTYSGSEGQKKLAAQGYDPLMVDAVGGAGTQVVKFRGGMPALGITRIFAQYRMANSLAFLDDKIRGGGADKSVGARGWDNYAWHTDLPPGHPMVTGQQTVDFDLCNVEHSKLLLVWGMNWICTKMPDAHWMTEARMKGTKVVVIACEYSATSNKGDEVLIVRPGTTPALALGVAQFMIAEKLYDEPYVKNYTDLPLLVRMDSGKLLKATDVFPDYQLAPLSNGVTILKDGQPTPLPFQQPGAIITEAKRKEWGDYVLWDQKKTAPVRIMFGPPVAIGFE
ncbi:MAG: molybdopterin-dependent oxidoreductase [Tepidisphaerales bacterium]